ncbi:unnamed protein product, partial [Ectocarpus sp. 12 AP-2014]
GLRVHTHIDPIYIFGTIWVPVTPTKSVSEGWGRWKRLLAPPVLSKRTPPHVRTSVRKREMREGHQKQSFERWRSARVPMGTYFWPFCSPRWRPWLLSRSNISYMRLPKQTAVSETRGLENTQRHS